MIQYKLVHATPDHTVPYFYFCTYGFTVYLLPIGIRLLSEYCIPHRSFQLQNNLRASSQIPYTIVVIAHYYSVATVSLY